MAAPMGRRAPSSSSIDRRKEDNVSLASASSKPPAAAAAASEKTPTPKKGQKKEVTSRIANLWKKVEDSKKSTAKDPKDPRVWIKQGKKIIPESELALLKPHTEQQDIKPRSKSRLSLRLSKFSKKGDKSSTPTSPSSTDQQIEDSLNGNFTPSAHDTDNQRPVQRPPGEERGVDDDAEEGEDGKTKRHSRLGSFFNPEAPNGEGATSSTPVVPSTGAPAPAFAPGSTDPGVIRFRNRSPAQASAIVPPFNYSPPIRQQERLPTSSETMDEPRPLAPAVPMKSPTSAQVKRNDSYVSSMGRRGVDGAHEPQRQMEKKKGATKQASTSAMVTLV